MTRELVPTNELGLALPPPSHDCRGESCPHSQIGKRCTISRHHDYFEADTFSRSVLLRAFREHPYNSHSMPRCRHDEWHDKYAGALVPKRWVMRDFLKEATYLQDLGVVIRSIDVLTTALSLEHEAGMENPKLKRWFEMQHRRPNFVGNLMTFVELGHDLTPTVSSLEVVPQSLVVPALAAFRQQAERLDTIAA